MEAAEYRTSSPGRVDPGPFSFKNDMPLSTQKVVRGQGKCGHYSLCCGCCWSEDLLASAVTWSQDAESAHGKSNNIGALCFSATGKSLMYVPGNTLDEGLNFGPGKQH
jgi:hypothetical protein